MILINKIFLRTRNYSYNPQIVWAFDSLFVEITSCYSQKFMTIYKKIIAIFIYKDQ